MLAFRIQKNEKQITKKCVIIWIEENGKLILNALASGVLKMKFWRLANIYWCVLFIALGLFVSEWEFSETATRSSQTSRMLAFAVLGIGGVLILFIQLAWRYYLAGKAKDEDQKDRNHASLKQDNGQLDH